MAQNHNPIFFQQLQEQDQLEQYLQLPTVNTNNNSSWDNGRADDWLLDLGLPSDPIEDSALPASPSLTHSSSPLSHSSPAHTLSSPLGVPATPVLEFDSDQPGGALPVPFDAMQTAGWMHNGGPGPATRFSHQRDSSRSSMGSNGPPSPFPCNYTTPQIAMNDPHDPQCFPVPDDLSMGHYKLAPTPKSFSGINHDPYNPGLGSYQPIDNNGTPGFSYQPAAPIRRNDRGLVLLEHPTGPSRSQPASAASSLAPDSPATPPEANKKRSGGETSSNPFDCVANMLSSPSVGAIVTPPLAPNTQRAIDEYASSFFHPNFSVPQQSSAQTSISPTANLFGQRVQAANNQHLSAVTNSPVSSASHDRSPFRPGSPLAGISLEDSYAAATASGALGSSHMRLGTAPKMRHQDNNAMRKALGQPMGMTTPQTISPKDAMLDYRESEGDGDFPLFHQPDTTGFDADAINKAAAAHSQQVFHGIPMGNNAFNNLLGSSMPSSVPPQRQFPFVARPRTAVPSNSNTSRATTRLGSADTGATESAHGVLQRPADTRADGGTYTCTYHGCTRRFDTPALLQKHKREGHRQGHGLGGPRRPEVPGAESSLVNTQAGPHRCDRVNPSTGKPCNTLFSRPYDLTRHEHTIHNARKQKVRCELCTDEKSFSRADALTRHYRVCHPDIEFPGKHRKRGPRGG
ncbi:hypothetical protein F5144DRAFT_344712 [Chaetomium tenue]|uniref:Uncharacterized protein n=1 Tax=Chaetomium tenue TaxID=1854479 RepID=A0ACB7NZ22_9PEZI|nr:hypothetical protein F5144DRAFT_344712 [Chaetomium globosum]